MVGSSGRKVVVTGSRGFIGSNLCVALRRIPGVELAEIEFDSSEADLQSAVSAADVIYHLAGVNRPQRTEEFAEVNADLTRRLCDLVGARSNPPLLVLSSSTQAALANPYGVSKREAEDAVFELGAHGVPVAVFRLPGVFGKWCRPNYNSVVATFCHNITRGLPIAVNDPDRVLDLVYVDDVVQAFLRYLHGEQLPPAKTFAPIEPVHTIRLGDLAALVTSFSEMRRTLRIPDLGDPLTRKLWTTYLSYLPKDQFAAETEKRSDARGDLAEVLKGARFGQLFVSTTHPEITRGNHYHDSKVEKFIVVRGEAVIRFRPILGDEVIEYFVSGEKVRVVDIPPGYTHSIENIGTSELVVLFWANEIFDPQRPDTNADPVLRAEVRA